jgi:lipopolysaccharide biosynthesis regulator YciM
VLLDRIASFDAGAGEQERTARLLHKLAERHPGDATLTLHLVKLLVGEGQLHEADALLDGVPPAGESLALALRGASQHRQGDAAAAADSFARALGPGLGLTQPWRCRTCGATAPEWSGRCQACERWNTMAAPPEAVNASDALIQDAKRSQPEPR